ncbi:MAG: radical SAM protein [Proteobacteria bacterium]|nr:radical SAM protein [Pseudomonadota bacterium]
MIEKNLREYIGFYFQMYDYIKNSFSEKTVLPPLHIYMEPINLCNLSCPFCATKNILRKKEKMDFNIFKKTIDDIVSQNWQKLIRLTLTGHGEPLLNKELPQMIKYIKKNNFLSVELITNGTILNKKISHALIESGLDRIQISIDSIKKTTYDLLRRPKRKNISFFNVTMANILYFLLLNQEHEHSVYTSISAILTSINSGERDEFMKFWQTLPVDNIAFPPLSTLQNNSPMEESLRFHGDIKSKPVCIIPWITLSVKSNGDVTICSHDFQSRYPIGNVKKDKLYELWNNEKARKLRKSLINSDIDYFVGIGHDCFACNNPCIGYGKDDFLRDLPIYMEKTVLGNLKQKNHVDTDKIETLKQMMEIYI